MVKGSLVIENSRAEAARVKQSIPRQKTPFFILDLLIASLSLTLYAVVDIVNFGLSKFVIPLSYF